MNIIVHSVPPSPPPPPATYDIVGLTREELEAVYLVLGHLGGSAPVIRDATDKLYDEIVKALGLDAEDFTKLRVAKQVRFHDMNVERCR